jgi:hypothetical protein
MVISAVYFISLFQFDLGYADPMLMPAAARHCRQQDINDQIWVISYTAEFISCVLLENTLKV